VVVVGFVVDFGEKRRIVENLRGSYVEHGLKRLVKVAMKMVGSR